MFQLIYVYLKSYVIYYKDIMYPIAAFICQSFFVQLSFALKSIQHKPLQYVSVLFKYDCF